MLVDISLDAGRHEVANGFPAAYVLPDVGGGNIERRYVQEKDSISRSVHEHPTIRSVAKVTTCGNWEQSFRRRIFMWRARQDGEIGEREKVLVLLPGSDLAKGVDSEQENELRGAGESPSQSAQRIDRVGPAGTLDLDGRRAKAGMPGDRAPYHRQTIPPAGEGPALVRRPCRRDEQNLVQRQRLPCLLGTAQVGEMDGVESAAEDAETSDARETRGFSRHLLSRVHARICPLPRMTYLYVVSSRRPMGPRACKRLVEIPTSAPKPNS